MSDKTLSSGLEKQRGSVLFSMLLIMLSIVFIAWIFIPGEPSERTNRACSPVLWAGKVVVSGTDLINQDYSPPTTRFFEEANYSCRYMVWKTFYYESWVESQAEEARGE